MSIIRKEHALHYSYVFVGDGYLVEGIAHNGCTQQPIDITLEKKSDHAKMKGVQSEFNLNF